MVTRRIRLHTEATAGQPALLVIGYVFILLGALALGFCFYLWLDARLSQQLLAEKFEEDLQESVPAIVQQDFARPRAEGSVGVDSLPRNRIVTSPSEAGAPLGEIEIRTVGVKAMILEGVENRILRRAVGHVPGTSLPGEAGNVALAGHRDTFFRGLRKLQRGDEITLRTAHGTMRYRVDSIELAGPEHTEVLADSDESVLTLVTCYPFSFVGSAPERFVVRARLATK